jgi:hypothetical protein
MALLRECLWALRESRGEAVPPLMPTRAPARQREPAPATPVDRSRYAALAAWLVDAERAGARERLQPNPQGD